MDYVLSVIQVHFFYLDVFAKAGAQANAGNRDIVQEHKIEVPAW